MNVAKLFLSTSKIILSSTCLRYQLEDPLLEIIKDYCSDQYYSEIEKILGRIQLLGKITSYSGGFTIFKDLDKHLPALNIKVEMLINTTIIEVKET